jgi:hypothetical protein
MLRQTIRNPTCMAAILLTLSIAKQADAQGIHFSRVSRDIVEARLRDYGGDNSKREATLKQVFADAGCDDKHLAEQPVKNLKQANVICVMPGSSGRTVIVGAHFDRVSQGDGVVDNWSGASLLPSLYQAVKGQSRTHTYIFIGFAGEEIGEIGSRFYVQNMSKDDVIATDAMVNIDTIGLGPTKVWGSHSDKLLAGALGYVAKQFNDPLAIVDVEQVGSSDSERFAIKKIPRITIHSLTQKTWQARILHTANDKISALNLDDYYQTYGLLAAYIAFLDQLPDRTAPAQKP